MKIYTVIYTVGKSHTRHIYGDLAGGVLLFLLKTFPPKVGGRCTSGSGDKIFNKTT